MKPVKTIIKEAMDETMAKIHLANLLWPGNAMTSKEKVIGSDQFIATEFPNQSAGMVYTIVKTEMDDLENGDDNLPDDLKGHGYERDLRNLGQ